MDHSGDIDFRNMYSFLQQKDSHLIRIMHWVHALEDIIEDVRIDDMDKELEDKINEVVRVLNNEMQFRFWGIVSEYLRDYEGYR